MSIGEKIAIRDGSADIRSIALELRETLTDGGDRLWVPTYGEYDHPAMLEKLRALQLILEAGTRNEGLEEELRITREFIDRCFEEFEALSPNRPPGSFGFVVPPRVRRNIDGENDEYRAEWGNLCPILKYFDSDIAQRFVAGLPPFIVDHYGEDNEGRHGYMICTPMFADMKDLRKAAFFETGIKIIDDTLAFAKRLGIDTVGFGATLPQFLFRLDRQAKNQEDSIEKINYEINTQGIDITTGHAGTVWLIGETVKRMTREGCRGLHGSIGILGTGSIGLATIKHLRNNLGYRGQITVYDRNGSQLKKAMKLDPHNIKVVENERELLESSDTIICAATTTLSLKELGLEGHNALEKKPVIIDDSQPGCFKPEEVASCGGQLVWVIGQDPTEAGELTCSKFDYNGFGPVARNEIWGCQLEAWAVRKKRHLSRRFGSLAVRDEVQYKNVRNLGRFLHRRKVAVARPQAQGKYISLPIAKSH